LVYIKAISYSFPEHSLDNEGVIEVYRKYADEVDEEVTSQSIVNQCGIRKRYISSETETSKDFANRAAEKLFKDWSIDRSEVEYLIFVSDALEYKGPTTACIIQDDLGLPTNIGAIDILHGCTGWIHGLSLAKALISSGQVKNVLLLTADVPNKVIHPGDVELKSIFSDGGAATFLSNSSSSEELNASLGEFTFGVDGSGQKSLWVERSATREPADIEWLKQYEHLPTKLIGGRLRMNSPKIFLFALRKVPGLIEEILDKHGLTIDSTDFFILHQANGTMLEFLRKRMKIPKEKFIISIENTGNTVSSSIPIAMKGEMDKKVFKPGNKVLVAGFGIGYSWGGTVLSI
jgi:3-oxoacyl-[acyl-carrier-protein] synthase-3